MTSLQHRAHRHTYQLVAANHLLFPGYLVEQPLLPDYR